METSLPTPNPARVYVISQPVELNVPWWNQKKQMGIQKINSYVCLPEGKPEKGDGNHQSIFIEKDVYI